MDKFEVEDIIRAINELNHNTLAHKVFQKCFSEAVKSGEIRGLKKSSLFRSTLAYFLFVPDARDRFLRELETAIPGKEVHMHGDRSFG